MNWEWSGLSFVVNPHINGKFIGNTRLTSQPLAMSCGSPIRGTFNLVAITGTTIQVPFHICQANTTHLKTGYTRKYEMYQTPYYWLYVRGISNWGFSQMASNTSITVVCTLHPKAGVKYALINTLKQHYINTYLPPLLPYMLMKVLSDNQLLFKRFC